MARNCENLSTKNAMPIHFLSRPLPYPSWKQDPFGNYVVQYILDLPNPRFSDALIRQFLGHICQLAVQKFSSNVIEKVCVGPCPSGASHLVLFDTAIILTPEAVATPVSRRSLRSLAKRKARE